LVAAEMRVAMALSGVTSIEDISSEALVSQG
jgi:isopentenyl diphosphate isomerase/L-lactate dehydrogenase-like FMN-dependent dehydrogenase